MDLSIVIPVYNEKGNLGPLLNRMKPVLDSLGKSYECLFIDDGSSEEAPMN